MRRFLPLILVLALFGAACSSSDTSTSAAPSTAPSSGAQGSGTSGGTDWPYQFVKETIAGPMIDTGDYAGQDLVLWFWAPW